MEFMKLDGFLGSAVSKLINKGIETKFGYKPDILISKFNLKSDADVVELNATLRMNQADFEKLFEEATK